MTKESFGTAVQRLTRQSYHFIDPHQFTFLISLTSQNNREWKIATIVFFGRSDGGEEDRINKLP
jgi:hypothetical protein